MRGLPRKKILSNFLRRSKSPKEIGLKGEKVVIKYLKRRGWTIVEYNPNRGKTDILAVKGNRKWLIQVKSSENGRMPSLSSDEIRALKSRASKLRGRAVIAYVDLSYTFWYRIHFVSAKNNRSLRP